ncbi:Tubulin-specific chaperone D [Pseudocercospora fuligena]|uniref:Tubulin-specific chaperone D n=1 Tax=Pseudocercospora fuligena TaxID=685502 RepID=A0A8H6RK34_9PEZI|nr:Tubulin-specific chaperone D [Pseudocercospora fuligena]
MENADEEDDLKLVKASAGLLADLEDELPKSLWKGSTQARPRQAHTKVRRRELDRVVNLIEPFQGEPQLLDAKLKTFLPPIVDAYLDTTGRKAKDVSEHIDIEAAICRLLYTFCKVRGHKVVVGFLNNEPRHLEPVLEAIEATLIGVPEQPTSWQVPYVLLLWLSHLLLTPFDLDSISTAKGPLDSDGEVIPQLPPLASRVLGVGLFYLSAPTKAQDAAANLLVRLCIRPDVLRLRLANRLVEQQLPKLQNAADNSNMYEALGSLRLVTGIAAASELASLVPSIYQTCAKIFDDPNASLLSSNAVAKKMVIKLFRNVSILSMRSAASGGPLASFLQTTGVLEDVIDYLLRSLAEKDTPVRYAAAKAISLIVLELDIEMGHEVIQAVLDSFKEDMPRSTSIVDFSTADPLRWHGLTLALGHSLFKRSASPEQLPDIFDALISALQFQQRTATGTLLGTNVRDAANFGIWSLARRYTTAELLRVQVQRLHKSNQVGTDTSIIQLMATQLVLSACLDPAGNIRRGSSAALQELVGRHPDQVSHGISLVQTVDYQAVSLRRRAMKDVAYGAARLHSIYADALVDALFHWRGLWSADVASRQSAALALPLLCHAGQSLAQLLQKTFSCILMCDSREVENLHGYALAAADLIDAFSADFEARDVSASFKPLDKLKVTLHEFSSRLLRSELPSAIARFATAVWKRVYHSLSNDRESAQVYLVHMVELEDITERLLWRHEPWILEQIPELVRILLHTKRLAEEPLRCIGAQMLCKQVAVEGAKSTKHGIGRAIALGTLATLYNEAGLTGDKAEAAVKTLCDLMSVTNIDWRVTAASALAIVIKSIKDTETADPAIIELICTALRQGLNDYTIDEGGDVGSLVRLQCIACFQGLSHHGTGLTPAFRISGRPLKHEIARLSLEKLDRVRLQAALCQDGLQALKIADVASVSSLQYFRAALRDIILPETLESGDGRDDALARQEALIKGCISCAGVAAESLLQFSRQVLAELLLGASMESLQQFMTAFTGILSQQVSDLANTHPTLELLAFLLDMQIPQRLSDSVFKWRTLLSVVQKSHHKSNDIPKILAAVHVYMGLTDVAAIRVETLKKLVSMLKTNPYPRVRAAVAEALLVVSEDEGLKGQDWARPPAQLRDVTEGLYEKLVALSER